VTSALLSGWSAWRFYVTSLTHFEPQERHFAAVEPHSFEGVRRSRIMREAPERPGAINSQL